MRGLVIAALVAGWIAPARAEVPREILKTATDYVEAASAVFMAQERAELSASGGVASPAIKSAVPESIRTVIEGSLSELNAKFASEAENDRAASEAKLDKTKATWANLKANSVHLRQEVHDLEWGGADSGRFAYLFSAETRWFWVASLLALMALAATAWYDHRHDLRRLFNGGRTRNLGVIKGLTIFVIAFTALVVAVILFGERLYRSKPAGARSPVEQLQELAAKTMGESAELTPAPNADKALDKVREAACAASLHLHILGQIADDRKALTTAQTQLKSLRETRGNKSLSRQHLVALLGTTLIGVVGTAAFALFRSGQQRLQKNANTCPMCLQVEKLKKVKSSRVPSLRCTNDLCRLEFPARYRTLSKLAFPTLGSISSGKTHWLGTVYDELGKGAYTDLIDCESVQSSAASELQAMIKGVLESRFAPASTQLGDHLRKPLMLDFRDRDPVGRSNLLVNIFDLPGEVMDAMDLTYQLRGRALECDGFLVFLDPTRPSNLQKPLLQRFIQDVRALRDKRVGEEVRVPVALVLSKIDLLVNQPYARAGKQNLAMNFLTDLCKIDPTGRVISADVLRQRSELTSRLLKTVWTGWEIEKQIAELSGGRVMFFPQTPVGINEPGVTDLKLRTIQPFAIIEPLLWLVHMNGFPVLK